MSSEDCKYDSLRGLFLSLYGELPSEFQAKQAKNRHLQLKAGERRCEVCCSFYDKYARGEFGVVEAVDITIEKLDTPPEVLEQEFQALLAMKKNQTVKPKLPPKNINKKGEFLRLLINHKAKAELLETK